MTVRDAIRELMTLHGIGFMLDPNGGAFYRDDLLLQLRIPHETDEEILPRLREWIAKEHIEVIEYYRGRSTSRPM